MSRSLGKSGAETLFELRGIRLTKCPRACNNRAEISVIMDKIRKTCLNYVEFAQLTPTCMQQPRRKLNNN
jgi:hypothetical protein